MALNPNVAATIKDTSGNLIPAHAYDVTPFTFENHKGPPFLHLLVLLSFFPPVRSSSPFFLSFSDFLPSFLFALHGYQV
jgi:hypothetical protein